MLLIKFFAKSISLYIGSQMLQGLPADDHYGFISGSFFFILPIIIN